MLWAGLATAQTGRPLSGAADSAFSFAVFGDSRTMMYLPPKQDQKDEAIKLMVELFDLVMPEKTAEALVKKDVKLTYDPATGELVQIVMPFMTRSEVTTLTVDQGWVTEASVEDVKLLPGVRRTMFRLQGGEWVAHEIVKAVQSGRAEFVVNSGDIVWWGNQGRTVFDSPYWKRVDRILLSQLPPPDAAMRAAGLEGRFLPSIGNHEVWGDPKIDGVLSAVPYMKKLGVSADQLTYKFDYGGARFIYLWTGKYDYRAPTLVGCDAALVRSADEAAARSGWMRPRPPASGRSSSPSTTRSSAAPAWAPFPQRRIRTSSWPRTRRTSRSSCSTGTCTRPSSTRWTA